MSRPPIMTEMQVVNIIKELISQGIVPSGTLIAEKVKGGKISRYDEILSDFSNTKEGKALLSKFDSKPKLNPAMLESLKIATGSVKNVMYELCVSIFDIVDNERKTLAQGYSAHKEEVLKAHRLELEKLKNINSNLEDRNKQLQDQLDEKRLLLDEKEQMIAELKSELRREKEERQKSQILFDRLLESKVFSAGVKDD